jgi:hypothetical protein
MEGREGLDRSAWQFLQERSGTVAMILAGGIILAGGLLMVYAAGARNHRVSSDGGNLIILALYTYLAGAIGYGLKAWKKRTRTEQRLDDARATLEDAVERVEELVRGPVVTRLPQRH